MHPYNSLPDFNYWSKAVSNQFAGLIDPVTRNFKISPNEKISTIGSCFAQHLSRKITASGFNYYICEKPPLSMSLDDALADNYGVFSARYGNVYTARQALQLFDRAFGLINLSDNIWSRGDVFVDAFRPTVQANGFNTVDELIESRAYHLSCVRDMFVNSDIIILTLGLTESWYSLIDQAVFPVAPGVAGGFFDPSIHEFKNFDVFEVESDLSELINKITNLNPFVRFIITVSPVPLAATAENRSVIESTVLSKCVLRIAANTLESQFDNVIYFPSYEIIMTPPMSGKYFKDDFREVNEFGVSHVMKLFEKHFMDSQCQKPNHSQSFLYKTTEYVVCDEDLIQKHIDSSLNN